MQSRVLGVMALAGFQAGAFEPPASYPVGAEPVDVCVAHLDGDGAPDLVTADRSAGGLTFLWNDGAGSFGAASFHALPEPPIAVAGGALRAGARVVALAGTAGAAYWIDGAGAIVAGPAGPLGLGTPSDLAVGDLDGAGFDDLVAAFAGDLILGDGGLGAVFDDGVAPLASTSLPAPPDGFQRVERVTLLDADLDGDLDVAATSRPALFAPPGLAGILLYENDGTGALVYAGRILTAEPPFALGTADFDADGHADLAVATDAAPVSTTSAVTVYLHDGGASFAPGAFAPAAPSSAGILGVDLVCADLGDDGLAGFVVDVDLAVVNFGSADVALHSTFDAGGGAFAGADTLAAGTSPAAIACADLNADSTLDLVVVDRAGDAALVFLATPIALAQTFGTGCAGTAGLVPAIGAGGLPVYGEPAFQVTLTSARPTAPALLGVAGAPSEVSLLGGCTLYLAPPIPVLPTVTDAGGAAAVGFAIPADVAPFAGINLYFQYLVFDPFGSYLGAYALSDGLRIKLGQAPPGS